MQKPKIIDVVCVIIISGLITWMLRDIFANFSTQIVGDGGDAPIFAWNLWWVKKALVDLKVNSLYTDYIFYPTGTSLVFHTLTITNGLFSIPLQYFFNLTETFNLIVLINFVLSGFFTYQVCRKMKFDQIASIAAGLIFALAPNIVAQTIGHTNLYSVWYIPALVWLAILLAENPSWKRSLGLAVVGALAVYNDYYIACFGAILVALYLLIFLVSRQRKNFRRLLANSLISVVFILIFISPLIFELHAGDQSLKLPTISNEEYSQYSGDLAGFITPSFLHRAGEAAYFKQKLHNLPGSEGVNYLGLLPVVFAGLALILVFTRRQTTKRHFVVFAIIGAIICLLLSLGPQVFLWDKPYSINFGWLYLVLAKIPVVKNLRVPIRFVTPAMLCLAILAAYVISHINNLLFSIKPKLVGLALVMLIGVVSLSIIVSEFQTKLWTYDARISSVYQVIAADKDDVSVMELPFRQKTGRGWEAGKGFSKQQLAQTVHNKKLLSGYISFADEAVKNAPLDMPGVHYLATNLSDLSAADQSSELARAGLKEYKIRYIVLSKAEDTKGSWYKMEPDLAQRADEYITNTLQGEIVDQDDLNIVYRIKGI